MLVDKCVTALSASSTAWHHTYCINSSSCFSVVTPLGNWVIERDELFGREFVWHSMCQSPASTVLYMPVKQQNSMNDFCNVHLNWKQRWRCQVFAVSVVLPKSKTTWCTRWLMINNLQRGTRSVYLSRKLWIVSYTAFGALEFLPLSLILYKPCSNLWNFLRQAVPGKVQWSVFWCNCKESSLSVVRIRLLKFDLFT